ncbi:hypothetical protein [Pseudomonas sp. OF001]|uniref:hypothetical protein n=1 Tax=Pseudomonas sp. OF001 TaxID=2772300 RepID=UPI00191B04F2|nr:hypothetical protein [Pseudomonas sp. OF001]
MSQLALIFDQPTHRQQKPWPYLAFDPASARLAILKKLAGGQWVRRMTLRRATGMRPQDVGRVLAELVSTGAIEENEQHPIIHPMHGHMGTTRGYRIAQEGKSHERQDPELHPALARRGAGQRALPVRSRA